MLGQSLIIPMCPRPPCNPPDALCLPCPTRASCDIRRDIMLRSRAITQRCQTKLQSRTLNTHRSSVLLAPFGGDHAEVTRDHPVPHRMDYDTTRAALPCPTARRHQEGRIGAGARSHRGGTPLGRRPRVVFPYPAPVNRMRGRDHNLLTNGVSLLICGLLAGVVVAAAMFPAVAMSGLAAKAGAETFDKLPSELEDQRAPQITRIYARDGKTLIAMMYFEFRSDVPLKDISKNMQNAIIAAEDHDFYKHNGVDVKGIARAFVANKGAGKTQQGASTLTMQYVRMSISYSATHPIDVVKASEDTAARKAREMRYALKV